MAADQVHRDAGRDLARAVVEFDPARIEVAHQRHHVVDLALPAKPFVADAAAGRLRHLGVLDVERGLRKQVDIAGMVQCRCVSTTSSTSKTLTPASAKASAGGWTNCRLRRADAPAEKPVSTTMVRPSPRIAQI